MKLFLPIPVELDTHDLARMQSLNLTLNGSREFETTNGEEISEYLLSLHRRGLIDWTEKFICLAQRIFEQRELDQADYLLMGGYPSLAFPLPASQKHKALVYKRPRTCDKCVAGEQQVDGLTATARKIGTTERKKSLASFHTEHQIFVPRSAFLDIFSHLDGVFSWPLHSGSGIDSENLLQLDTHQSVNLDVSERDVDAVCPQCGTKRYYISPKSFFYKPMSADFDVAHTVEFLGGSEHDYLYPLIVSQRIYRQIINAGIGGGVWWPCRKEQIRFE